MNTQPMEIEEGWLPISVNLRSNSVRWMEFGKKPLLEPFFFMTIQELRATKPPAREAMTSVRRLIELGTRQQTVIPSAVIFHISRCGSTLLANVLRMAESTVVLSEAQPVMQLLCPDQGARDSAILTQAETSQKLLLDCLTTLFARNRGASPTKLIIKGNGLDMLQMRLARLLWPDVPFVVLIRDPIEVIMSLMREPAGWLSFFHKGLAPCRVFGWAPREIRHITIQEYMARGIGVYCESALEMLDDRCLVVDYENLTEETLIKIGRFVGVELPSPQSENFKKTIMTYSKDRTSSRMFEDDRRKKQDNATQEVRDIVQRWANEPYKRLKNCQIAHEARCADRL